MMILRAISFFLLAANLSGCIENTAVQRQYASAREKCRSQAETRLSLYHETDAEPLEEKEKNNALLALFSECMKKKDWKVAGPAKEEKPKEKEAGPYAPPAGYALVPVIPVAPVSPVWAIPAAPANNVTVIVPPKAPPPPLVTTYPTTVTNGPFVTKVAPAPAAAPTLAAPVAPIQATPPRPSSAPPAPPPAQSASPQSISQSPAPPASGEDPDQALEKIIEQ